jgi:hypothetical protein
MTQDTIPYEAIEDFYEGIKEDIPDIIRSFAIEKDKVKRTITLPKTFDTVFHRVIRADLLRLHGVEITYSDLLTGFAMVGLATLSSKKVIEDLSKDADLLNAYDEARLNKRK